MKNQSSLKANFWAIIFTQFFGALNDNFIKLLILTYIMRVISNESTQSTYASILQVAFFIPFLTLSPLAGSLADKISKRTVMIACKFFEVLIAGCFIIAISSHSITGMIAIILFLGLHSTVFSPAKYGSLPEVLNAEELSKGNGILEMMTFLAILSGTVLGTLSFKLFGDTVSLILPLVFALIGLTTSFWIPKLAPADSSAAINLNPVKSITLPLQYIKSNRGLLLATLGIGVFWGLGVVFQNGVLFYAKGFLLSEEITRSIFLASLTIGIGAGSLLAGKVSAGRIELGLVPIGGIGITIASVLLFFSHTWLIPSVVLFILLGLACGFFVVPLSSFLQEESPSNIRGSILGAANVISYFAMVIAAIVSFIVISKLHLAANVLFLILGLFMAVAAYYSYTIMPEMFLRCINWIVTNTIYNVRTEGIENIPSTGGALIIANHITYADPSIILATAKRPVRFLMYRGIYEQPFIKKIAQTLKAVPISEKDSPKDLITSIKEVRGYLEKGEIVCIFAEGALTRIGQLLPFQKGFERVIKGLNIPIIPAHLDLLWGSALSHHGGPALKKLPRKIPYPLTLRFGKSIPSNSTAFEVRNAVMELGTESFSERENLKLTIGERFIESVKKNRFKKCCSDSSGRTINYIKVFSAGICLSKFFRDDEKVGILLPPTIVGAITNVAVTLSGSIAVNINYTVGSDTVNSIIKQSDLKTIVTSRKFEEKLKEKLPINNLNCKIVYIEDLFNKISVVDKFLATASTFLPIKVIYKIYNLKKSKTSTILFSSGSSGEPKGVVLSHKNILSNIEGLSEVFGLQEKDVVVGILPFFHSFGFTGTLWLSLISGLHSVYHPDPLDAKGIGEITEKYKGTILLATPTFLLGFIRKVTAQQFKSLRIVITGAEKLKENLSTSFAEKFGVKPYEGYGATELSPVAALNLKTYADNAVTQVGNKQNSVGLPLPGISIKVVDAETLEEKRCGEEGLLIIKGSNVMEEYLNNPIKTAEVKKDGWYLTGDIAKLDEDGFIFITDRLSRFSKIGGEMVPHVKIEDAIIEYVGMKDNVVIALTAVPDEKKGERLVVVHAVDIDEAGLGKFLQDRGFPNLWVPKCFVRVDAVPMLGSGKIDLKGVRAFAEVS